MMMPKSIRLLSPTTMCLEFLWAWGFCKYHLQEGIRPTANQSRGASDHGDGSVLIYRV